MSLAAIRKRLKRAGRDLTRLEERQSRRRAEPRAFGEAWMRRYLPHYLSLPPSRLHRDLAAELEGFHAGRGRRENWIAPRGSAKTTWATKGYALWAACEGVEPYTLLLSETAEQAEGFLESVKGELEENPRIARDYPRAAGRGPVWQATKIRLRNGVMIQARGVGAAIRGLTNRSQRPSLVIVDDPNEDADAYSPALRAHKLAWFHRAVMAVGSPQTNVLVLGTPIHRQAIVWDLKNNGGWQTRLYRSLESPPARPDLWLAWERLFVNLADADRLTRARAFYDENRAEMDAGAEVLWPEREALYDLMVYRAVSGPGAFGSEKQSEPGTDGATEWPAELFDWEGFWFDQWPPLVLKVQSLDPSKGKKDQAGDYQAHVRAGLAADGTIYVEADLRREPARDMIARALDWYAEWHPAEWTAEGNNTLGLLVPEIERQLAERRAANRPIAVNYREVIHSEPKLARIRSVGGYLSRRQIRVRSTPGGRMLVDQWRDVPAGEFDDGPDAVATAIRRLEQLVNGGK